MCPLEGKYYSVSDARLGRGIVRNSTSFRLVKGFRSKYPSDYDTCLGHQVKAPRSVLCSSGELRSPIARLRCPLLKFRTLCPRAP